jgi:hypothetical protein
MSRGECAALYEKGLRDAVGPKAPSPADNLLKENARDLIEELSLFVLGPVLALVVFYPANDYSFDINARGSLVALVWTLIAYVVTIQAILLLSFVRTRRLSNRNRQRIMVDVEKSIREIKELASDFNVSIVRDSDVAMRVSASVIGAAFVRNTFVNIKHLSGVRSPQAQQITLRYESFLSRNPDVAWHDIVGTADFIDGRYSNIFRSGVKGPVGTHKIHILNSNTPIINFLPCAPDEGDFLEVYFGWISNQSNNVSIFYSSDARIISLFNDYFNQLLADAHTIEVDP